MRRFQDNGNLIQILDDAGAVFSCPSAEFAGFETTYQAVPSGRVRTWTPEVRYVSDGSYQMGDPFYMPDPTNPTTILPISQGWRFTIRKVISEKTPTPIDSTVKSALLVNGHLDFVLTLDTPGVWLITDADFDLIRAADWPQFQLPSDFQVVLVGGAKFFKVY